ncbi:triose-phosphate isomerase [Candidatus Woesearchaeota archaeon]|nr:triose-phosphate isomerase [Candidatus Woesearchaeota archaeon]
MRRVIIAANWKMNKTDQEAGEFIERLVNETKDINDREILVFPSSVHLKTAKKAAEGSNVTVGCQNMYHEDSGAYTGEISPLMVKEFCSHILIGHSERRGIFSETDTDVNKKLKKAFEHGLLPVVCIGETKEEKDAGKTKDVVSRMIEVGLSGITEEQLKKTVIAYEPVWAISRGDPNHKAATSEDAQELHSFIRGILRKMYGPVADDISIIYGGSAKPGNIKELMSKKDIDGVLSGNASLELDSFMQMVSFDS